MPSSLTDRLTVELAALEARGRLRSLADLGGTSRIEPMAGDIPLLSFCSNDYLGLASHPDLADAAAQASRRSGFGAAASRLVSGNLPEHRMLELQLAAFVGLPAALLFPTGYQANVGALSALANPQDLIVADRGIHASLIDGCRLSGAKLALYPHLRLDQAERHLRHFAAQHRRRFLVTESLFSMDGDLAPLADLSELARAHDAALLVDEAHALGVLGPRGSGLCAELAVVPDILVGTLGKAFGCAGAFVAGSTVLRELLLNCARTFVFTTAIPPPLAAAALRSLAIVASPHGDELRARLMANASQLRALLQLPASDRCATPILPIILGSDQDAVRASAGLRQQAIFVQAIRPPTVREGTARLRLTVSASHTPLHLARLASALRPLLPHPLPQAQSSAALAPKTPPPPLAPAPPVAGAPPPATQPFPEPPPPAAPPVAGAPPLATQPFPEPRPPAAPPIAGAPPLAPPPARPLATAPLAGAPTLATQACTPNPPHVDPVPQALNPRSTRARPRGIFIAGTDTAAGKTVVASAIAAALADRGFAPVPFKPVESGDAHPSDAERLRSAARRANLPLSIICPIPLRAAIAPAAAARLERTQISLPILEQHLADAAARGDFLVVEAAGGLLSPYAPGLTSADLARAFQLPLLLVAKNSLGTVNHTALAIAEIHRRALPFLGVILVQTHPTPSPDQPFNCELIADIAGVTPLGTFPFLADPTPACLAGALNGALDLDKLLAPLL